MFQPTWDSIDARPIPSWFDEAKFGIFIHWGLYSVPAWGPKGSYAEWYWHYLMEEGSETRKFHNRTYGEAFKYPDFAKDFKAELYEPDKWADVFKRAGARYVVLTSKHHEGYCLWPNPQAWNWNSVDTGPHRDLLGDLTTSVRKAGLMMGFYYSLYEWYHPLYLSDPERYVVEHMIPQIKDLVTRYAPSILWTDGEWDHPSEFWKSAEILAWLLNEGPNPEEVVINDRWGKGIRNVHGGFYTTEYGDIGGGKEAVLSHKWEECRGIGRSFGYNRNEDEEDYQKPRDLIHMLIDIVAKGGNLLLDVGPTADGRIPVIMQQRLLEMGKWLEVNGEAIYGTKPWKVSAEGESLRYTAKGETLYAISKGWPGKELLVQAPIPGVKTQVTLLGYDGPLKTEHLDERVHIEVPPLSVEEAPCQHAFVFKLERGA